MAAKLANKRKRMFNEQDGLCFYCNKPMWLAGVDTPKSIDRMATVEHIIPPKLGGDKSADTNLLCTCHKCNRTRGQIDHSKFIAIRKQSNWQVLAREEHWRMLGMYRRKVIERRINYWRKQNILFDYGMCKIEFIRRKIRKFVWCVIIKNKQRYTDKTKSLILNTFAQFETVSFKPLSL